MRILAPNEDENYISSKNRQRFERGQRLMMLATARATALSKAPSASSVSIPSFLLPAFHNFTSIRKSHIGRAPLSIPPEVNFTVLPPPARTIDRRTKSIIQIGSTILIEGPLGKTSHTVPPFVHIDYDEPLRRASVKIEDREVKQQREMWGTTRADLQNRILGVSEGHTAILRLVGVGYRATIENTATTVPAEFEGQQFVSLKVGYSHPIELPVPKGITASTPQPTRILLEGISKEDIMQFAAIIRKWRVPEPYKGKGISVNGETIKLKAKKIK